MSIAGIDSRVSVWIGDEAVRLSGQAVLIEDLHDGSWLRLPFVMETTGGAPLGEKVRIALHPRPSDAGVESSLSLWCAQADWSMDGTSDVASLEAFDPIGLCAREAQFRSHGGKVPLARLTRTVVSQHGGVDFGQQTLDGATPTVGHEWLLQCNESGAAFLRRVARSIGHLVYWNRDRLTCGRIGSPSDAAGESPTLRFGEDLIRASISTAPDLSSKRFAWTDPTNRTSRPVSFSGRGFGSRGTKAVMNDRVCLPFEPLADASVCAQGWPTGGAVTLETTRADIVLGSRIQLPREIAREGCDDVLVSRVEHWFHGSGSYGNRITCVPRNRWGVSSSSSGAEHSFVGPVQGEVTHNADPNRLGRVRVTLSDDPAQNVSPWIPFVTPVGSQDTGMYWLPEIGSRVLLIAESSCPENLYCIGCLWAKESEPNSAWMHDRNATKALVIPGGIQILLDEQKGIRLETANAGLEITPDGKLRAFGKELRFAMDATAEIRAQSNVLIDAKRIDLGR